MHDTAILSRAVTTKEVQVPYDELLIDAPDAAS
jgi:hypothetical protein